MPNFMSLLEAAAKFEAIGRDIEEAGPLIVKTAAEMIAARAKEVLGTDGYGWPALAESTVAHKTKPGMLLETGELRNSIEWNADGLTACVGTNLDRAVWLELGTSKMPPRSFLVMSAMAEGPKIEKMAMTVVRAAFNGRGSNASRIHEILHLLHLFVKVVDTLADAVKSTGKHPR